MSSFSTSLSSSPGWDFADLVYVRLVSADGFGMKQQGQRGHLVHLDHDLNYRLPLLPSPVEYPEFASYSDSNLIIHLSP